MEYMEVQDEDCHHYVIPTDKWNHWNYWLYELPEDSPNKWDVPDYATFIDGGHLIFETWRIGNP
jgi:hypothetical protein